MHAVRVDEESVLFIDNEESAPQKSPRLKAQHGKLGGIERIQ